MKTSLLDPKTPGIELTEHGLRIRRLLSVDEWREMLKSTRRVHSIYHSVLSDLTHYGRQKFGDAIVNDTLEQLEFDLADALKAETIALVGYEQRAKYALSSEHAYVLGKLLRDDEPAREKWASDCLQHSLSAFELQKSIEAGEVVREDEIRDRSGRTDGVPTVQGVRFQFERWMRQFSEPDDVLKLPVPERRKVLEVLQPLIELAARIETSITA